MKKSIPLLAASVFLGVITVLLSFSLGFGLYVLGFYNGEGNIFGEKEAAPWIGFFIYVLVLWVLQESFERRLSIAVRAPFFYVAPSVVFFFRDTMSIVVVVVFLVFIATLATYEFLLVKLTETSQFSGRKKQ